MEIDDRGAEFAKMAGRLSSALPSLAGTSSISNQLKREVESPPRSSSLCGGNRQWALPLLFMQFKTILGNLRQFKTI